MKYLFAGALIFVASFTVCAIVRRLPPVGGEGRSTLAERDDQLASRARRPEGDLAGVPTPANPHCSRPPDDAAQTPPPSGAPETSVLVEKPKLGVEMYGATWCGPCKEFKLILPELKERGYITAYWDIDEHPNPHAKILPTTYLYRDGKYLTHIVGVTTIEAIEEEFK